MKLITIFLLVGIFWKDSSGQDCYPDMFNPKGSSSVETISVNDLDTNKFINIDEAFQMFGSSVYCVKTSIVRINTAIKQSKHFKITGLEGFLYDHRCYADGFDYRFIGSKSGLLRLSNKLSLLNPHFFTMKERRNPFSDEWSIAAFGKFYPCSDEQNNAFNADVKIDDYGNTVMKVRDMKTFNATWPHYYLSDNGEPLSSIHVFDLEKYMHFSPATEMLAFLTDSNYEIIVEDQSLQLKANPDSNEALLALGRFTIKNKEYSKEVVLTYRTDEEKRNFIRSFSPTKFPFDPKGSTAVHFMNNLLSVLDSIGELRMKSTHGNPRDTKTRYQIDADAEFDISMKSRYLMGLNFGIRIIGTNPESINFNFLHSGNKCRHETEGILGYISTDMKRLAQKMPGETKPFYENKVVTLNNYPDYKCELVSGEDYLMHSIDMTYMEGANDKSVFRTTVKWEYHESLFHTTLHTVTALLKFDDFVNNVIFRLYF